METVEFSELQENRSHIFSSAVVKTPNIKYGQHDPFVIIAIETGKNRLNSHVEFVKVDIAHVPAEQRQALMVIGGGLFDTANTSGLYMRSQFLKGLIEKDIETCDNSSSSVEYREKYANFLAGCHECYSEISRELFNLFNKRDSVSKELEEEYYKREESFLKALKTLEERAIPSQYIDKSQYVSDMADVVEKMDKIATQYEIIKTDLKINNQETSKPTNSKLVDPEINSSNKDKSQTMVDRVILKQIGRSDQPQYLVATKYVDSNGELCIKQKIVSRVTSKELNMSNKEKVDKIFDFMSITAGSSEASAFSEQMLENIEKPQYLFNSDEAYHDVGDLYNLISQNDGKKSAKEVALEFLKDPQKLKNCYKDSVSNYIDAFYDIVADEKKKLNKIDTEDDELDADLDNIMGEQKDLFEAVDDKNQSNSALQIQEAIKNMRDIALYACDYTQQKIAQNNNSRLM